MNAQTSSLNLSRFVVPIIGALLVSLILLAGTGRAEAAAPTVTLSASKTAIKYGEWFTLTWSASVPTTKCASSGSTPGNSWSLNNGSPQTLNPFQFREGTNAYSSATYTLSCTDGTETTSKSVTITLLPPPAPSLTSANSTCMSGSGPYTYPNGGLALYVLKSAEASTITVKEGSAIIYQGSGYEPTTRTPVYPPVLAGSTHTYTVTASNKAGDSTPATITVTASAQGCACNLNGTNVLSGSSITAWSPTYADVPASSDQLVSSCSSESRLCTNGTLAGSYTGTSCTVDTLDLVGLTITNSSATTGSNTVLTGTIKNQGNHRVKGSTITHLFQKATDASGTGATDIGTRVVSPTQVDPGETENVTFSYTFPANGVYYIRICADKNSSAGTGIFPETNEDNNCGAWKMITASTPPTGSLTVSPTSCQIAPGASTCSTPRATWTTANASSVALVDRNTGTTLSSAASQASPGLQVWAAYPQTVYDLKSGSTLLSSKTVTTSCATGGTWDGTKCAASCSWNGGTVASGQSVTAYQSSVVVPPASCVSQQRTCSNGTLSGTYTAASCSYGASATLSASPNPVRYGDRATLTWTSSNATSCTAGGPWLNSPALNGSGLTDPLTADTTFTFQCTGPNGPSALQSVTVTVTPLAGCALPWGGSIASGSSTTAYQTSIVTPPATCTPETRSCTDGVLSGSYTYQSCGNLPTAVLSASPSTINQGNSATLTWSSTNATSCTSAGGFSTAGATSGTAVVSPSDTSNYSITCTGTNGTSTPALATVTVVLPNVRINATPSRVLVGNATTVSWSALEVSSCTITRNTQPWKSLTADGEESVIGSVSDTVTSQTVYLLSCRDVNDVPIAATSRTVVNVNLGFQEF